MKRLIAGLVFAAVLQAQANRPLTRRRPEARA